MKSDGLPTFEFGTLEEHISQLLPDFIENFIHLYGARYLKSINEDFSFYSIMVPDRQNNFLTIIQVHDKIRPSELYGRYQQDIMRLYLTTMMSRKENPVAINLKHGHYAMDYFQSFIDIGCPDVASDFTRQYKTVTAHKIESTTKKNQLDNNIQFLKKFAKDNNQFKDILTNSSLTPLKQYCDGDFECYFINGKTLNIVCHASSIVYSCVFEQDDVYKTYAQRTHYGHKCEAIDNPDYIVTDEPFEKTLVKYMYKDEFLIFEKTKTNLLAYDLMINDLLIICNFIVSYEKNAV